MAGCRSSGQWLASPDDLRRNVCASFRYLAFPKSPAIPPSRTHRHPNPLATAPTTRLQTVFHKQFSHGIQFQAAYTWSHAIDDAADPLVAPGGNRNIARNSFNLQEERGTSDYDLRHRLIVNYVYEFPFGPGHRISISGFLGRGALVVGN